MLVLCQDSEDGQWSPRDQEQPAKGRTTFPALLRSSLSSLSKTTMVRVAISFFLLLFLCLCMHATRDSVNIGMLVYFVAYTVVVKKQK
jgi:hypothetical protein